MLKRLLGLIYGVLAYVLFFCTLLYIVGFVGNVFVPRSIDSGPSGSPVTAAVIDGLLLSVFALQHSIMARHGFKQQWTRVVSWYMERSTYVVAASLALMLLLWQWRPIPAVVWDLRSQPFGGFLQITFWIGWTILLISTFLINHFELFGLEQVWAYFRRGEWNRPSFKTPGLYAVVRHPIYLGFLIAFWSAPAMTVGHLLFCVAISGYLLVGIHFEERDLIALYGPAYRDYCERVPMLIPFLKWGRKQEPPEQIRRTAA